MILLPLKTHKITVNDTDILSILETYLPPIKEKSIVAITSKIVSICQGRMVKTGDVEKDQLIVQEANRYLPRSSSKYNVTLTITHNILAAGAGIDESNADGHYILWPKDPQKSANEIRAALRKKFSLSHVGVVITDSTTAPLRWGTTGVSLAHSGFAALHDYVGHKDIFGRAFEFSKSNIADGLAAAAVVAMGEGAQQTPLALIKDVPFVAFQDRDPTSQELNDLKIALNDDVYAPLLTNVKWQKGKGEK